MNIFPNYPLKISKRYKIECCVSYTIKEWDHDFFLARNDQYKRTAINYRYIVLEKKQYIVWSYYDLFLCKAVKPITNKKITTSLCVFVTEGSDLPLHYMISVVNLQQITKYLSYLYTYQGTLKLLSAYANRSDILFILLFDSNDNSRSVYEKM